MEYQPVPTGPGSRRPTSSDLDSDHDEKQSFLDRHRPIRRQPWRRPTNAFLVAASILNLIIFISWFALFCHWYYQRHVVLNPELRRVSTYSPIHDLLDLELHATQVNGTLFPPKNPSFARQTPSPEADAMWQEWEVVRFLPISRAQILRMGKDPSTVAKFEDEDWGMGDDAYVGDLDVFHQLHCLNSLRKFAYGAYYNRSVADANGNSMREIHVNHCVDILVQALMCSGNVNILTSHWVATQPYPFPDMSVNRKCINFEKLQDWRNAHAVDLDTYLRVMRKPKGVKERPAPDALYAFHNWENPNHAGGTNPDEDFNF